MNCIHIDAVSRTVTKATQDGLADLQRLVGGYIERVPLQGGAADHDLICDEEGLMKSPNAYFGFLPVEGDTWCRNPLIVGNAVVVGTDHSPEWTEPTLTVEQVRDRVFFISAAGAVLLARSTFRIHELITLGHIVLATEIEPCA